MRRSNFGFKVLRNENNAWFSSVKTRRLAFVYGDVHSGAIETNFDGVSDVVVRHKIAGSRRHFAHAEQPSA